jgi:hypothetical protein
MNIMTRRIAAVTAMAAAPALIALGAATASQAQTSVADNGPSISHPTAHQAFPNQKNFPKPGTREHHHHQWHRHG